MKNWFTIFCVVCLLAPLSVWGQSASALKLVKVAVVDFDRILQAYPGYEDIRQEVAKKRQEYDTQIQEKKKVIATMEEEYKRLYMSLSAEERTRREIEIDAKKQELAEFTIEANKTLDALRNDLTRNIYNKILVVIQKIGNEKRYTLILTKETTGLLFYDKSVDITANVISRIKAEQSLGERN
ncbi:OmpH family outer membrane protein [Thermospira aquatica]|uniref:OmpH family outer membrane protein n=1 Tax=Thermospira aquatica TaxID=2828656 RepID=A0AAX3BCF3_9SPIR|nr:OmpH family outer membrane protein [Thermospira aquatica]URA09874.1 OmpH family outer membrane protein [Thermospira aquatica]